VALTKSAILSLRATGFREATQEAVRLSVALKLAHNATFDLGRRLAQMGNLAGISARTTGTAYAQMLGTVTARTRAANVLVSQSFGHVARSAQRAGAASQGAFAGLGAGAGAAVGGLGALTGALGQAAAAMASAAAAGAGLFSLLQRGEKFDSARRGFERLTASTGGAASTLDRLRRATGGAVSDLELMLAANRLLTPGIDVTTEKMEELFRASIVLARVQGIDLSDAIRRVALGVAKAETELVDELGLTLSATEAVKKYAEANGIAADEINTKTKRALIANYVLAQARENTAQFAGAELETATATAKTAAEMRNLLDGFSLMLSQQPGLVRGFEALARAATAFLDAVTPIVKAISAVLEKFDALDKKTGGKLSRFAGQAAAGPAGLLETKTGSAIFGAIFPGAGALGIGTPPSPTAFAKPSTAAAADASGTKINVTVPLGAAEAERLGREAGEAAGREARSAFWRTMRLGFDAQFNRFRG